MGRKEGGSLFQQAIRRPGVFILADRTNADGSPIEVSFKTRENYYDCLHRATDYFKARGIRRFSDITKEMAQEYADHLIAEGKTPSTVKTYLAPLCKAIGFPRSELNLPLRRASEFTRSSGGGRTRSNSPGELNAMLGLRKSELARLRGNSFVEKNGILYVIVTRGKGGKYQEQKVLPHYEAKVRAFFDGSSNKLFTRKDFVGGFDYHGQRRGVAAEALQYYMERAKADPGYRKELYKEIADQWHVNNKKYRDELEPFSYFDTPYKLRGQNRELAVKQGLPTELDRLVLRAVSVLHLAHWRDKVTIQSYYFKR